MVNSTIRMTTIYPADVIESRWPNKRDEDSLESRVRDILQDIVLNGDAALLQYTSRFDGIEIQLRDLQVDQSEIDDAYAKVTRTQVDALKESIERLRVISESILERLNFGVAFKALRVDVRTSSIPSVGCYIPGGTADYPSSVLMCAVPALVAGVKRIVICTPPNEDGSINPLTLVASDLCGVEEIYRVGGAQAIAALAYGTKTILPVTKIVGPGNKYVTMAKRLVSKDIPIDMPAGPSELVILADSSANPMLLALDLLSQAEHDVDAKVVLVTNSKRLAKQVVAILEELYGQINRRNFIEQALAKNGLIYVYESLEDGIRFINQFAPEHLMIISEAASQIKRRITSCGLVLIGSNSPVAASDYMLGVNHVLPTNGYAKVFSGLSVLDFVTVINEVKCTKTGLALAEPYATLLAEIEGLTNHASAIRGRWGE
ncbi:MAG: histidinol dehydrogenase [Candidatus Thorarchaeota archaeon]